MQLFGTVSVLFPLMICLTQDCLYMFADDASFFYDYSDLPINVNRANNNLVVVINHLENIALTLNPKKN